MVYERLLLLSGHKRKGQVVKWLRRRQWNPFFLDRPQPSLKTSGSIP